MSKRTMLGNEQAETRHQTQAQRMHAASWSRWQATGKSLYLVSKEKGALGNNDLPNPWQEEPSSQGRWPHARRGGVSKQDRVREPFVIHDSE